VNTFGPANVLSFVELVDLVGVDPEPFPQAARDEVMERQRVNMARAEAIYCSQRRCGDALFDLTAEFVYCFGEFQRAKLLPSLKTLWERRLWSDASFGALLRTLHQAGCTTSTLFDEISVDEFAELIENLPSEVIHTSSECGRFCALTGPITVYRGGWAATAEGLVSRGVSWSLSKDIADGFVTHGIGLGSNQQPFLLRTTIQHGDVLALFDHEQEVVVLPNSIQGYKSILSPKVLRLKNRNE